MNERQKSEKYKNQSVHYFENALGSIQAGDAEKAGEFLWGSVAEALKAVAASKGIELKAHWDIRNYARNLAKERNDRTIDDAYRDASYLHSNFYEAGLRMEEVSLYAEEIREVVRKLLELIPAGEHDQGS